MNNGTYGTVSKAKGRIRIEADAHVLRRLKRMLGIGRAGAITLPDTPDAAEDVEWFHRRYPLTFEPATLRDEIHLKARLARIDREAVGAILSGQTQALPCETAIPLRDYQRACVDILRLRKRILCGDSLGLGKTANAIGWADFLKQHKRIRFVVMDECQELRKDGTAKYEAAQMIAAEAEYALGLTATPTYNYGDEIYRVLEVLSPGCLGTASEFFRDWCSSWGRNWIVSDPPALGQSLVDRQLILRRRRRDVGRELPALNILVEAVPYDAKRLEAIKEESVRLAKLALGGAFNEAGQAIRQLDLKMRQVTGIAKAPYVADFVKRLADSGEKVLLAGWHREVYAIWHNILGKRAVFYTGTESPAAKQAAVDAFTSGAADVFIISLRSGAGLDGLQKVASIIAVGELDWSPEVHNQLAGRLNRDGQDDIVTLCYLIAAGGSDPLLASILNLKGEQAKGIRDPGDNGARDLFTGSAAITREETRGKLLAKAVLEGLK